MQYQINKSDNIATCVLTGELTFNDHDLYRSMLAEALDGGASSLSLDLAGLEFIDSAGMGMLLVAQDQAQNGNWKLSVQKPQGQVKKMLELAKLSQVISIV